MSEQSTPNLSPEKDKNNETLSRHPEREAVSNEHEPVNHERGERQREQVEAARSEVEKESVQTEKHSDGKQQEPIRITKEDKQRSYNMMLSRIQSRLPAASKSFSKVIHNKYVERTSETLGKTIARPSGILGGAMAATLGLVVMLYFARRNGFALSGSELGIFLIVGWVIGLSLEGIGRLVNRR